MPGRLVIFVAPSGGGKTSVIRCLMERHPDLVHSVSQTTRSKRPGGVDDGYYRIVDDQSFRTGVREGAFAEWAEVHGSLYGTPRESLERNLAEGRDVILDLDVVGALNLKREFGDRAITIFLVPPSLDELQRRLAQRGADSQDAQVSRLRNAVKELEARPRFDHQVVNDVLDRTCREVESILYDEVT